MDRRPYTEDQKQDILKYCAEGYSKDDIKEYCMAKYGRSPDPKTIKKWQKEKGTCNTINFINKCTNPHFTRNTSDTGLFYMYCPKHACIQECI